MANANIKTEMKGDTSRWGRRQEYKDAANARRRAADKKESGYFDFTDCITDPVKPLLTEQLFCEADTLPIGKCPCVKCKRARDVGNRLGESWARRRNEMLLKVYGETNAR